MGRLHVGRGLFKKELVIALRESTAGDEILLDPGVYDLHVPVSDRTLRAASDEKPQFNSGISIEGKATLIGLSISHENGNGINVSSGSFATIADCELHDNKRYPALYVQSKASVQVKSTSFRNLSSNAIHLTDGARGEFEGCTIIDCETAPAIYANGLKTLAILSSCSIRNCSKGAIVVDSGARLQMEDGAISDCTGTSLTCLSSASAFLKDLFLQSDGNCVFAEGAAKLQLTNCGLRGSHKYPLIGVVGSGTEIDLKNCRFGAKDPSDRISNAVRAIESSRFSLTYCTISGTTQPAFVLESKAEGSLHNVDLMNCSRPVSVSSSDATLRALGVIQLDGEPLPPGEVSSQATVSGTRLSSDGSNSSTDHASNVLDIQYELKIDFWQAIKGVQVRLNIHRSDSCATCSGRGSAAVAATCEKCNGTGTINQNVGSIKFNLTCTACSGSGSSSTCPKCHGVGYAEVPDAVEVRIPKGIPPGSRLRVPGKGNRRTTGEERGDLYITVTIEEHAFFKRFGDDIHIQVALASGYATHGGKVEVTTIDGAALLKIPPGTQDGQKFRLREKGVLNERKNTRGDQIVQVHFAADST
jgi:hypothetical protein